MELSDILKRGQRVHFVSLPQGSQPLPKGQIETVGKTSVSVAFAPGELSEAGKLVNRGISMVWQGAVRTQECPVVLERIEGDLCYFRLSTENRREYLRVPVQLTLVYEPIDPEAVQDYANHILSQPTSQSEAGAELSHIMRNEEIEDILEDQFDQMSQNINKLNAKLDYLISLAEGKKPEVARARSVTILDLSGAGLSFVDTSRFEVGDHLKLLLQLNRFPLTEIRVLGKVVRCDSVAEPADVNRYETGLFFAAIHEDDREKVFRFIVKAERKMLRERKELLTSAS